PLELPCRRGLRPDASRARGAAGQAGAAFAAGRGLSRPVAAIHEFRRLPWSAAQMFDLVADVARYSEFLPWVVATRVRSDNETEMIADMLVGFSALREKFTSRV